MNKFFLLGALPAVLAVPGAGHGAHGPSTTKTVYQTQVHTVTSCGPTVTNCPYKNGKGPVIVTEVVPVSTTVCAVTEEPEPTKGPVGCSTSTAVSDCVHTITKTAPAFVVTTKAAASTITKKVTEVSTSTCVHTLTGDYKGTVTTVFPTTLTKDVVETKYTDCVHTVTGATSLLVVTTAIPTTYTICPAKPTGGFPTKPEEPEWPVKPVPVNPGQPAKPEHDGEWTKPTGAWGHPEPTGASPAKPIGTGGFTKTVDGSKAVVTAGASAFGASGAIAMLGAAAALLL